MNRYPLWKYLTVLIAVVIGLLYTLPNLYGESPAVQVSSAKATLKIDAGMLDRVQGILQQAKIVSSGASFDQNGPVGTVRVRFANTDTQIQARDLIEKALNPNPSDPSYTVALNLLPASPSWLSAIGANPMYLGLDLRVLKTVALNAAACRLFYRSAMRPPVTAHSLPYVPVTLTYK